MAYGNWGAWVFRNGEHQPTHEDQTPYHEETMAPGYHQAFGIHQTADAGFGSPVLSRDAMVDPHHAVLGGADMRLCGYKNWARLYHQGAEVELTPFKIGADTTEWGTEQDVYEGEIDGYRFRADQHNGNMIDLLLVEPDGTRWTARCGYGYGAGIDDGEPRDRCEAELGAPVE